MGNYVIKQRYEFLTRDGAKWTNWHVIDGTSRNSKDTDTQINELREKIKSCDRITKLHHEYDKMPLDDYEAGRRKIMLDAKEARENFDSIKKTKKPWAYAARKERKALQQMDNAEKTMYLARKRKLEQDDIS